MHPICKFIIFVSVIVVLFIFIKGVAMLGLSFFADYVSKEEEKSLLKLIDSQEWSSELSRRVQHYGYRYNYASRKVEVCETGILKDLCHPLLRFNLHAVDLFDGSYDSQDYDDGFLNPTQVIVNEYNAGDGISAHVDADCFGDRIVVLSLGSGTVLRFTHVDTGEEESYYIPARSLLIMEGEARTKWKHEIPKRRSDMVDGKFIPRERRVSITYRTV